VWGWDLLFYATFGVVVTSTVQLAGVLLVFSFLVVPAVCAVLLARSLAGRLLAGWTTGVAAPYPIDLPTGATVVCTFGAAALLCGGIHALGAA